MYSFSMVRSNTSRHIFQTQSGHDLQWISTVLYWLNQQICPTCAWSSKHCVVLWLLSDHHPAGLLALVACNGEGFCSEAEVWRWDKECEQVRFAGPTLALWQLLRSAAAGFLEWGGELLSLPASCWDSRTVEPGAAANLCKTICFYHLSLLIHKCDIILN